MSYATVELLSVGLKKCKGVGVEVIVTMSGVGFGRHPRGTGDSQIHLWKQVGEETIESYCGEYEDENRINSPQQVDSRSLDSWWETEDVCDECVKARAETYPHHDGF